MVCLQVSAGAVLRRQGNLTTYLRDQAPPATVLRQRLHFQIPTAVLFTAVWFVKTRGTYSSAEGAGIFGVLLDFELFDNLSEG